MIGVYTALFGKYDNPQSCDYNGILFTDQDTNAKGWDIKQVKLPHDDTRYASRYYFDQSCLVMPDYEYTVMHGGNARLTVDPQEMIKFLPRDIDLACCAHPRKNVYEEAKACIRMKKDDKGVIREQMDRYKSEGFDGHDLSACIILVRRNTPALREFENMLWQEVSSGSCRDQLAFDYCRWKLKFPIVRLPQRWTHYLHLARHIPKDERILEKK